MRSNVMVTGGAGFIGSHLVRGLLEAGANVRVLDNLSTGRRENLCDIVGDIDFHVGDIRDYDQCLAACQGVEVVFHLGALGSVARSIEDPFLSNSVNVQGTLNLLMAARAAGVRRFVFSSSSSVYGDTPVLPKHEEMRLSPRSPYAVTKLAGEEYCRSFHIAFGMETVALRYFNVFGPRQDPNSHYAAVIPRFASALLHRQTPKIYGDGLQSRDFTYVANVVKANLLAATAPDAPGQAMNIACGEQITLCDLLDQMQRLLDIPLPAEFLPARVGDVRHSRADITLAQRVLGYEPVMNFAEGLEATVDWYRRNAALLS